MTATDSAGNLVVEETASWTSVTPEIATVSPTGTVTAVASGEAIIEGTVRDVSARGKVIVVGNADLAAHNFDDGLAGPYSAPWGTTDLDFPSDPTGSGRGRVARFHYHNTVPGDRNRAVEFTHARRFGEPLYFKGEFNVPVEDLAAGGVIRKLIYFQSHNDWAKYPKNGGLATGRTVVHLNGKDLKVDAVYNPAPSTGRVSDDIRLSEIIAPDLKGHTWYTLEVFQQMESAIGRADGILRVWLDGKLVFERQDLTWSDPAWVGDESNGVQFEAKDIYFEHFLVGQQLNWWEGAMDEYRYWDNIQFSTKPIK
jgi:hypothetical protein